MSIRARLLMIIAFTMGFSIVAVFCLQQVSKGALFHQLNVLHLKYTIQLKEDLLSSADVIPNIAKIERTIRLVRHQPIECLANVNWFDEIVMKAIGTDFAIQYCKDDIDVGNKALEAISRFKQAQITVQELREELSEAADVFYLHSHGFEPLIEKTVDFITVSSSATTILFAIVVIVAIAAMARSITMTVAKKDESEKAMFEARAELEHSEQALRNHRDKLENTVAERTEQLTSEIQDHKKATQDLRTANEAMKKMQKELVQSEKMASLGGLVAGIAHEINTPMGAALTAASYLEEIADELVSDIENDILKKSQLHTFTNSAQTSTRIIVNNLRRAAELVGSFKQVAVDQSSQENRQFHIAPYLDEVLMTLHPNLKKHHHQVSIECPPDLEVYGDPGALSQVITNLVMNSLVHAYDEDDNGNIRIAIVEVGDKIQFTYSDDGYGMAEETCKKVFDPFFTTKRGQGGSGLGMNIVFNLVTQTLKGSITCSSELGKGVNFVFSMARNDASVRSENSSDRIPLPAI